MNFHITAPPHGSVLPIAETRWRHDHAEEDRQRIEANAHLIAAAPDLLEAAKHAEEDLLWAADQLDKTIALQGSIRELRAAIAKAKGEAE